MPAVIETGGVERGVEETGSLRRVGADSILGRAEGINGESIELADCFGRVSGADSILGRAEGIDGVSIELADCSGRGSGALRYFSFTRCNSL